MKLQRHRGWITPVIDAGLVALVLRHRDGQSIALVERAVDRTRATGIAVTAAGLLTLGVWWWLS